MNMSKLAGVILVVLIIALGVFRQQLPGFSNGSGNALAAMQARIDKLERQAGRADDYIAIANLQASYGYYVDKAQWDDAADLFAADSTLEIAGRGVFAGQERIRTFLKSRGPLSYGKLYNHMQLQPVIIIADDGLSARSRWRSFMQVGQLGKEARWGEATYNNDYVKDAGVWKIKSLHSFITFYVDFDKGWNKAGVSLPSKLDDLPPDADSTVKYGAFPEVFVPPYPYKNPVTGK